MALFDVIQKKKIDDNIVWRYPKNDFNTSSQLIVHEGQEAVFLSNGKILDLFTAGKYTLSTDNLPLLKNIIGLTTGFRKPFQCEVYFIEKTEQSSKWGTNSKIQIMEPTYNFPLDIGACGELKFVIEDSKKILEKLIGIKRNFDGTNIDDFFQSFIMLKVKTYIAQIISQEKINIFEIDQKLEKFSEELKEKLKNDFSDYGIKLERFIITNIAKPEDDKKYLEFKELYFRQGVAVAEAELNRKVEIINKGTESEKIKIEAEAMAEKRSKEGYTYQEERGYNIGEKVAENQAVGQFTNIGVGLGMISGIGNTVGEKINKQVVTAFTNSNGKIVCKKCNTENEKDARFCKKCGNELVINKICPKCGNKLEEDSTFCSSCGERID